MPLSFLRVLSRKDLHWRQGLACWTGMWIHWKSLHKRWTQIGVSSCSKYQGYNNGQNIQIPTLRTYIEGLVEGMARQSNQWYSVLEGDGAKEKYRARKDRPKGWSEFALLKHDQGRLQKKVTEPALCLSQAEGISTKGLRPARTKWGQKRWGQIMRASDCEHCGIYCDVKTRYAGEEFAPRRFRIAVSLYGLIIHYILPFL